MDWQLGLQVVGQQERLKHLRKGIQATILVSWWLLFVHIQSTVRRCRRIWLLENYTGDGACIDGSSLQGWLISMHEAENHNPKEMIVWCKSNQWYTHTHNGWYIQLVDTTNNCDIIFSYDVINAIVAFITLIGCHLYPHYSLIITPTNRQLCHDILAVNPLGF